MPNHVARVKGNILLGKLANEVILKSYCPTLSHQL